MVFLKPCLKLLLVGSILSIIYVISEASLDSSDQLGGVLILILAVPEDLLWFEAGSDPISGIEETGGP